MKEITFISVRVLAVLLFIKAILYLEELYHGIMATYYSNQELFEMTYPSIIYFLVSIGVWFGARRLASWFSKPVDRQKAEYSVPEIQEIMINTIGVFYLLSTIPNLVMYFIVSTQYIMTWGIDFISKVDAVLFACHLALSLAFIYQPKRIVVAVNKIIKYKAR